MDLKNAEWEYDCGHGTPNEFSNLPPNLQRMARKQKEVLAAGLSREELRKLDNTPGWWRQ
jgi:hypothetical protein